MMINSREPIRLTLGAKIAFGTIEDGVWPVRSLGQHRAQLVAVDDLARLSIAIRNDRVASAFMSTSRPDRPLIRPYR